MSTLRIMRKLDCDGDDRLGENRRNDVVYY